MNKTVVCHAIMNWFTGYGQAIEMIARGIESQGYRVIFLDKLKEMSGTGEHPYFVERMYNVAKLTSTLQMTLPNMYPVSPESICYTMWESTRMPEEHIKVLKMHNAIITPSHWCKEIFENCGVRKPIYVIPLGIHGMFVPSKKWSAVVCKFGTAGRLSHGGIRKGVGVVCKSFARAFPDQKDVLLEIKIWPDDVFDSPVDSRIRLIRQPYSFEQLADWYRSLLVYVSASRGEGFGLQPAQALACGTSVIAANYGGHREFLNKEIGYELDYREVPVDNKDFPAYLGNWAEINEDDLVDKLRYVYNNRKEAVDKGEKAAIQMRKFRWSTTAIGVLEVLKSKGYVD